MFIFEESINFITFPLHVTFQDIDWVQTEKHVFETASNHPFLVGLHSCFQTPSRDHPHTTSLLRGGGSSNDDLRCAKKDLPIFFCLRRASLIMEALKNIKFVKFLEKQLRGLPKDNFNLMILIK